MAESRLPAVSELLVSGGDARIHIDPASGRNAYGCLPVPEEELLAFGSCTASSISPAGLAAASHLHTALQHDPAAARSALTRQRASLQALLALPACTEIVFAGSGSELHLIAAQLVAANTQQTLCIIGIDETETGSQVPAALRGLHFGRQGRAASQNGQPLMSASRPTYQAIAVREADGTARPPDQVDADYQRQVQAAANRGAHVLLIVTEVAKSGLLAPGPVCVRALQQQLGSQRLTVLVDACQFRLKPARLRDWLASGCLLAITGSKFFGGPSFSGALLLPAELAARWRKTAVPASLHDYSTQTAWPAGWSVAALPGHINNGLLLRWEAALAEMRAFHALTDGQVEGVIKKFAAAIEQRLVDDPQLSALPLPAQQRAAGRDAGPTIFSFLLRDAAGHYLDAAQTASLQRALLLAPAPGQSRCQFGQPVICGQRAGHPVAALRLCLGARQIVAAARSPAALVALCQQAGHALDLLTARLRQLS
ncbi:MAG: hypothetical protein KUL75_04390 [Sterolibacterium sp.]|nr:hypothetical protein [Sterolibacterium sp.]